MNKIFAIVFFILLSGSLSAQIKKDQQRQRQQQQYEQERKASEMKEAARKKKAQLSLPDLMKIADMGDVSSVDKMLSEKGWQMSETESGDGIAIVTFAFDKSELYKDRATYWAHWACSVSDKNVTGISYVFNDEVQFSKMEKYLSENGFKRKTSQVLESESGGIETMYQNNRYEINLKKS